MMSRTHLAFSILISLLVYKFFPINPFLFVFLAGIGSFLPDIDSTDSKLGRKIKVVGILFKHRGFFHSILFCLIFFAALVFFINAYYALALVIGVFTHILSDAFTREGVHIFYPLHYRIRGFIQTNSLFEKLFFVLCILFIAVILL